MTREVDYALRILRALNQNSHLSAAAIAQKEHMPKAITLKILKQLHAVGLTDSRRGNCGGYLLSIPCEKLYLGGLVQALEESPLSINAGGPATAAKTFPRAAAVCAMSCHVFSQCWTQS